MYAFLILAAWRVMLELSKCLARTRIAFLIVAIVAAGALLYHSKTAENSFTNMASAARRTVNAQQIEQPSEDKLTIGKER